MNGGAALSTLFLHWTTQATHDHAKAVFPLPSDSDQDCRFSIKKAAL